MSTGIQTPMPTTKMSIQTSIPTPKKDEGIDNNHATWAIVMASSNEPYYNISLKYTNAYAKIHGAYVFHAAH